MSAILRFVRSYANNRSSVLDTDPKLVCKEMQKGILCELKARFEPRPWMESKSGFFLLPTL